ncbi:hypothetical protein B6G00_08165 [Salinivibrio sp. YCSC6]|nr:hypothetical protein B6G00_08165 [Salinivibrio sp. YCSC6]
MLGGRAHRDGQIVSKETIYPFILAIRDEKKQRAVNKYFTLCVQYFCRLKIISVNKALPLHLIEASRKVGYMISFETN